MEALRGKPVSWPLPTLRGCLRSRLMAPFLSHSNLLFPLSHLLLLTLISCLFYKDLCEYTGPIWIIQDHLPISKFLKIMSAKALLSHKVTLTHPFGIRIWTSSGTTILPPHSNILRGSDALITFRPFQRMDAKLEQLQAI